MSRSTSRAGAGLVLCVALWGMVFIGVHQLLPELDPLQILTLRFTVVGAAFALLLLARPQWRPRLERRDWPLVLAAAVTAVPGSQLPIMDGQRFLSPPIAALIVTFSPAVAAVLAALMHRERLTGRAVAGFAVALAGVAMIVVLGAGSGAQLSASNPAGAAVALVTPVAWAAYTLLSKPLATRHHTIGIVGVTMIVGALALAPLAPHALAGARGLSAGGWGWLTFLALGGSAGPYLLWSASLKALPVSRTAAFMYLVPVFALLWTATLLGQAPSAVALGGGLVVLAGVALTQVRVRPCASAT
jgi:drug/metabolite transporter (DMT)-like permease